MNEWMNEWKRLLAEIKNIKLNTNNNINYAAKGSIELSVHVEHS